MPAASGRHDRRESASPCQLLKASKVRYIAIADETRLPGMPNIPTQEESAGAKSVPVRIQLALRDLSIGAANCKSLPPPTPDLWKVA